MNSTPPADTAALALARVTARAIAGDSVAWDAYLAAGAPRGLFYRRAWDSVFAIYRLPVVRLMAWRSGRAVGLLPLVWQKSLIFGNRLVSLPWLDAAGILADDGEAHTALADEACRLAVQGGARELLLRQPGPVDGWQVERDDKATFRLALERDPEALWKRLTAKVRNQVRKGEKSGLEVATGGAELAAEFYRVYSINMRDLGSPSHGLPFFKAVMAAFPDEARIHIVRLNGAVVGGGLTLANGDELDIPWASSLADFNRLCVNHAMYWHILKQACLDGFAWFNFGRSTLGSGQHHFKAQWGCEQQPVYWYALDRTGRCRQDRSVPQESFGAAIRVWRRLPVWLTRCIGPRVICGVP